MKALSTRVARRFDGNYSAGNRFAEMLGAFARNGFDRKTLRIADEEATMGRRGPAPTPTKLKVLRGETRPSRVNYNEPKAREGVPEMPAELTPAEQEVWRYTANELTAMGVLTRADRDALAAYCRYVVQFTEASALLQREPLVIGGDRGCRVRNPAVVIMRDAAQMMAKYAAEFGLTPRARAEIRMPSSPVDDELERLLT